jgi:murein DD-endopeptidase MepM/ murein hydrolase activator NlpD
VNRDLRYLPILLLPLLAACTASTHFQGKGLDISGREKHDSLATFCSLDSKKSPYGYRYSVPQKNSRPTESCQVKPERNRNPLAGNLRFPVDNGCLSSPFGYRKGIFHSGLDITAEPGEPIRACADGEVVFAGTMSKYKNYGKMVLVDHGDGVLTRYAHASKVLVAPGKRVKMGDRIALVGRSGRATAPHLHLEIEVRGKLYNPLACFSDDQLQLVRVASRFPMPPLGPVGTVSIFHKHLASLSIR